MEIIHEGWLTKSPPEKRIWKAKWRERWFVLKNSGDIPGQYVLEYYADASRRKLKGSIDLDQCEQVDAGLQLESRKANYKHMFDVRTSKRTFYLVAKSEADMNKWVDCICSVCGLKIHVDEDYRYSPQPSQEFAFSASANQTTSQSTTAAITTTTNAQSTNVTSTSNQFNNINDKLTNHRVSIDGPSGPYIPISECHTGKPINGSGVDDVVPTTHLRFHRISDESYDVPRHSSLVNNCVENQNSIDLLYHVPSTPANAKLKGGKSGNPPRVNWSTYPRDSPILFNPNDSTRTSIRSCNAVIESTGKHSTATDSGCESFLRSSSPYLSGDYNRDSLLSVDGSPHQPPPRPPKPPSLRRSKSKSESCASLPSVSSASLYDVPAPPTQNQPSPTTQNHQMSASSIDMSPKSPDDAYDFPRQQTEFKTTSNNDKVDLLNERVPLTSDKSLQRDSKKHSYINAPSGFFVNKENVFNYEYKPTLSTTSADDSQSLTFKPLAYDQESSERSPDTPTSSYMNLSMSSSLPNSSGLNTTPPAVNRDLKPRRKGSDSDTNTNGQATGTLQLAPPPALTRIQNMPTKKSFRKPRTLHGQPSVTLNGTPPRIPSRGKFQHNRDPSTSEDDLSIGGSRRNSSNDEQYKTPVILPQRLLVGSEIQYLDLDLDSDSNSQSPRTPNEHHHQRSNSTLSNKESPNNNTVIAQAAVAGSTVYKTVDFLKTEAFNKILRQNVETNRNSQ